MDRLTEEDITDFVSKVSPRVIKQFATGHLGVTNSEIEDIEGSNRGDIQTIKYQIILIWYNKDPRTRRELFHLCRKAIEKRVSLPYESYEFLNPDENRGTDDPQATQAPLSKVPKPSGSNTSDKDPTRDPVTPKQGGDSSKNEPDDPEDVYPTDPKHKNLLLIINQFTGEREGTEFDGNSIKQFFENTLKFTVLTYEDLSKDEIKLVLEQQAKSQIKLSKQPYDRLVVAIFSHGDEKGISTCEEGGTRGSISIDEITTPLNATNFQKMAGKPKLFFFQACRGKKTMGSVRTDDEQRETMGLEMDISEEQLSVPSDADILICYATTEGHLSYRDTDKGSWFIQILVEVFNDNYKKEHVMDMLVKITRLVGKKITIKDQKRQIPCMVSTLRKKVFLTDRVLGGEAGH